MGGEMNIIKKKKKKSELKKFQIIEPNKRRLKHKSLFFKFIINVAGGQ